MAALNVARYNKGLPPPIHRNFVATTAADQLSAINYIHNDGAQI